MDKRRFLTAVGLAAGGLPATRVAAAAPPAAGPALLTVSGAVPRSNRAALDPALDQLMVKHGIRFERAWTFDAAALQRLPPVQIRPTLEYDAKPHTLHGPLLEAVLRAAGIAADADLKLGLRALDGYNVQIRLADAKARRTIVAIRLDGRPMPLGGLGPQWAVFDPAGVPDLKDKALNERFAQCPWGLYHVDVQPA